MEGDKNTRPTVRARTGAKHGAGGGDGGDETKSTERTPAAAAAPAPCPFTVLRNDVTLPPAARHEECTSFKHHDFRVPYLLHRMAEWQAGNLRDWIEDSALDLTEGEDDEYIRGPFWGLSGEDDTPLLKELVHLAMADGTGGQFALWVHGARDGFPAATVDTAPVVHVESEGQVTTVAHSVAGFLAWQCVQGNMDGWDEDMEDDEDAVAARAKFVAFAKSLGVEPLPDAAAADKYLEWSDSGAACPRFVWFGVDMTQVELGGSPASADVLVRAIEVGYMSKVRECLAAGVPLAPPEGQEAVLARVCGGYHRTDVVPAVQLLLERGAPVDDGGATLEAMSPLACAAQAGNLTVVQVLVQAGADVNKRSSMDTTPLMYAVQRGKLDVVRFLLAQGAGVATTNKSGETALTLVDRMFPPQNKDAVRQLLVDAGAGEPA